MEQVTAFMDQTIARTSASEVGDVKWLTKSQFLAPTAFEDMRVEKRGSHANSTVAVSLPPVTRAMYTRE
eukprot:10359942-Prorocentrum_lima.AAC.1